MSTIIDVNAHLHTPYSFSAFDSIGQAVDMAAREGVKVVGINDFYSMDGYGEWKEECARRSLFPLFNIEFISLNQEDQAAGLRVNDPNNPGRTYLSGKGLNCPPTLSGAPKVRAMELIAEFEKSPRGVYGGAAGYFSNTGDMDFAIVIRTLVKNGRTLTMRAGAGIVADSDPMKEYQETVNKSKAVFEAVKFAEELS